ncbi:MAG TPA: hypothetical protein PK906_05600, partial [Spirochaetota bacterium]|nr:hypothetical protein [Spirochaetota bacterium]
MIKNPVLFFLLSFLCGCGGIINSLSFFPDTEHFPGSDRLPQFAAEKFLITPDRIRLQILHLRHEKGSGKIIIYFHGNAGNLYGRMREGVRLFNMGHDVIISGYRGYGRSSGEPTEKGVYIDGRTVCDYVNRELKFPEENIFIYGRSIGTTVAVDVSMDKKYGGVILVTPLTSAVDFIKAKYPDVFAGIGSGHFESE